MSIEFDPQCGTSQPEDCLKLFIPAIAKSGKTSAISNNPVTTINPVNTASASTTSEEKVKIQKTVTSTDKETPASAEQNHMIKKYNTENGWSTSSIIVPGNTILLSLETASNYLMDHKLNRYGFKCTLIGYENIDSTKSFNNSLINLESEFTYLGGMCSANLMRKDLIFSGNFSRISNSINEINSFNKF